MIMWISRLEFERLEKRIEYLEKQIVDPPVIVGYELLYGYREQRMPISEVIDFISKHLGITYEYQSGKQAGFKPKVNKKLNNLNV